MKFRSFFIVFIFVNSIFYLNADESIASFTPPAGWGLADESKLPPSVRCMVIGKGKGSFPPSINLAVEPFAGTTEDYLKIVKRLNQKNEGHWRELGPLKSAAGTLQLSQLDSSSEWGSVRMIHAIIVADGNAYILTAASIKEEFFNYQKDFFRSFSSFSLKKELKEISNESAG